MAHPSTATTIVTSGVTAIVCAVLVYGGLTLIQPATGSQDIETTVRDYLLENPEILVEMDRALAVRQEERRQESQQQAIDTVGVDALLDPMIAYVEGPADAEATVVEFFDYHCGFCKASLPAMKAVMAERPDVKFAFIEYPILSEESVVAARAAVASRNQPGKYIPFHLALMETQGALPLERILSIAETVGIDVEQLRADMDDPAVTESLQAAQTLAENLQIGGTPTFVVNGDIRAGQVSAETLTSLIDADAG